MTGTHPNHSDSINLGLHTWNAEEETEKRKERRMCRCTDKAVGIYTQYNSSSRREKQQLIIR